MGTRDRKARLAVLEKAHAPTAGLSYMQAQITNSKTSMSAVAFHEKAGRSQGKFEFDFDFAFLNFTFLPSGGFSERPERSRARILRRQRTLDGEDRSVSIRAGRKVTLPLPACALLLSPPFHPHSSLSDSSLGASWVFSFQPVLPPDYRPLVPFLRMNPGPGDRRSHRNSALWALVFSFPKKSLCC